MNRKPLTRLICLLLSLTIVLLHTWIGVPEIARSQPTQTVTELRGVWLTNVGSAVMYVPWGIHRAVRQLAQLHFNTVYPVVWNRGNTLYSSKVAERVIGRSQDPFLSAFHFGQDVLAETLKAGEQHNVRVIPWFEYGFITPLNSELALRHPDWLTMRQNGAMLIQVMENEGIPRSSSWLNPFHPEVQQFILDMVTEVVTRYGVSGIQFDDHFGLPAQFGYDAYTMELYQNEHQGLNPPSDPFDPDWIRWRADKLTEFMGHLVQAVKAVKPDCIISLSPNSYSFSYRNYLQDWLAWVERGWVEELVLQVYRHTPDGFQAELDQAAVQTARQRIPVAIGIHTGSFRQITPFKRIQEQVETVRSQGFNGVAFFYWESLWGYVAPEAPRERRSGFQRIFLD
ncbi:MAG: family 10 glycosylhydrolase [Cyanobacteria bacterium CRU_2_1]|nr:family 10 glycosylhydrolase [Cyanobacteria bacterium RU_5_0]NJR58760.1 family 10 glycosylhydrolase [Cyanobacteria bacterium CRU_2_1]